MTVQIHNEFDQKSLEWIQFRCGKITASNVDKILTPTLKLASNDKERQFLFELLGQRITNRVPPQFISDAMLRGESEEIFAREMYTEKYGVVTTCAYVENDKFGFPFGYSPDGLVGDDGLIEVKSRSQKFQVQTLVENKIPEEFVLQIQAGLMISERKWGHFISYSNGMPLFVLRVEPDPAIFMAIETAVCAFEARISEKLKIYNQNAKRFHVAEWREYEEIIL